MPGTSEEKLKRRYDLNMSHAYYEFNKKKNFKAALELLSGTDVSPAKVLRLYPWLLPKQAAVQPPPGLILAPLTDAEKKEAVSALTYYLTEVCTCHHA